MEYKTYGDKGHPVLVFPSQNGRFYDYQDFDMVGVLSSFIDRGFIRLICVDSIDGETWSDMQGDHHRRIALHEQWFHYIIDELIPELRHHPEETFIVTGCSMGGFHAANFFFRRPDLFDTLLALSGLYYAGYFFPNYRDPLIYDNSPYDFLRSMPADHHYWDIYRHRSIVMCVGQGAWEDDLLESTRQMDALLREKNVPAWIDYWGHDVAHDWAWWRKQIVYFMDHLLAEKTVEYAIITYETRYMQDFIRLNKQWIETWFRLEQSDLDTFAHIDDNIIGHGGQIFLAIDESGQVVGCCALKPHPESDCHELAKMAVSPDLQGKGIGRKLGEALLEYARSHDVKRIFLEGNTRLEASIALYRKLGFKEIPLKNNAYERCDILMEIIL